MKDPTSPLTTAIASFNAAKRSKLSEYTKAWYKNAFEGFLEWLAQNGEGVLRDLDAEIVTQYLDNRLDHGRRVKQLPSGERVRTGKGSAHQARQAAVALKSLASYLARNGVWHDEHERAVLHAVEFPKVRDETRDELTAEEIAKGLSAARRSLYPDRDQAILQFILGEGTRLNETRLLRVGDIDFENASITRSGRDCQVQPQAHRHALARGRRDTRPLPRHPRARERRAAALSHATRATS